MNIQLHDSDKEVLRHLAKGGIVAYRIWGKRTKTIETASQPKNIYAGLLSLSRLEDKGLVIKGNPSPYKTGISYPLILTEKGRKIVEMSA